MTNINAYLHFSGECREAMTFYKDCFGGELLLQTVEGSPMESQCPGAMKHFILHAMLQKDGLVLMASDMTGPEGITKGNSISLTLNCSSEKEIDDFFSRLSAGGRVIEPLKDQFWNAKWGVVRDRYNINWMLNFDKSKLTPVPGVIG